MQPDLPMPVELYAERFVALAETVPKTALRVTRARDRLYGILQRQAAGVLVVLHQEFPVNRELKPCAYADAWAIHVVARGIP